MRWDPASPVAESLLLADSPSGAAGVTRLWVAWELLREEGEGEVAARCSETSAWRLA